MTWAMGAVVTGCGGCEDGGVGMGAVTTVGVAATWLSYSSEASIMSTSGEDMLLLAALELLVTALKDAALGCDAIELASVLALNFDAVPQDPAELPEVWLLEDDNGDGAGDVGGLPKIPPVA